jgi:hypothetical protein
MPTLQAEGAWVWEAAIAVEVTHVVVVLAAEASAQEAAAARDSVVVLIKDAEDQATLVEREVWERVSRVEAENATVLAYAREDVENLVWKIALLKGELLWRSAGLERWPRRIPTACSRGCPGSTLRSSTLCRPEALSCAYPLSVPHG